MDNLAPTIEPQYLKQEEMRKFTLVKFEIKNLYKQKFYTPESEPEPIYNLLNKRLPHLFLKENKIHITIKDTIEVNTTLLDTWLENHSDYKLLSFSAER